MSYIQAHLLESPHWVYRLYGDADSRLLYIGCTSKHPRDRIISLRAENPRVGRADIRFWSAVRYRTGPEAHAAEGAAIDVEAPPLNRYSSGVSDRAGVTVGEPIEGAVGLVPPRKPR